MLGALLGNLSFCNLLLDVFLQLFDGVELGSQLCELVVSCGQLALLDCGELDLDDSLLACVLATGELGEGTLGQLVRFVRSRSSSVGIGLACMAATRSIVLRTFPSRGKAPGLEHGADE